MAKQVAVVNFEQLEFWIADHLPDHIIGGVLGFILPTHT